jgi:hypothetical protein
MRADRFFHLDLLRVSLLLVEFGAEAAQILRILAGGMAFAGYSFADTFIMVESDTGS